MSGTAGGTVILHISPEATEPQSVFGIVQTGDVIECDIDKRLLQLHVSDEEIASRIQARRLSDIPRSKAAAKHTRGYLGLYKRSVNQAHLGADFDFLTAAGPS